MSGPQPFGTVIWWESGNEQGRSQLYVIVSSGRRRRIIGGGDPFIYDVILFWASEHTGQEAVGTLYADVSIGPAVPYTKELTDEQASAYGRALLLGGRPE